MCAGRIGDFQAIGYPGSFSLNFSLRSALLLEEKERCEEVTEEMGQVHSCAWKDITLLGLQQLNLQPEVSNFLNGGSRMSPLGVAQWKIEFAA